MYQYEKRLDCHAFGKEVKRKRKGKGWTQEHLAQLVDLTPRSIMYIENRGQHTSLDAFYKIVTLLDISVDEFFYPEKRNGANECRKHLDRMLNGMDERELSIMETVAEGIVKSREVEAG
ncbi:MAG: helix-turn-helix domain-containing protein [Oscillospiraceae bacterium]|nr:helix-turn-helix domain-containing protein [Oscillospiraceae bacterium]